MFETETDAVMLHNNFEINVKLFSHGVSEFFLL